MRAPPVRRSLAFSAKEYARGIAGGLVFSLPLLFTMEVWWTAVAVRPVALLVYVATTFLLLIGYNRFAGLRVDASFTEVLIDSVEEAGIGMVLAFVVLWTFGLLHLEMGLTELLGKVVLEGMTVAIGVSVGTAQLGADDEQQDRGLGDDDAEPLHVPGQFVIAACGAVLFAASVAPTDEIAVLAGRASPGALVGVAAVSWGLGAMVLRFSDFVGSGPHAHGETWLELGLHATMSYAVALGVSAGLLLFFGHFDDVTLATLVGRTVVLGVAGSLGASAGRLLLQ
jgi:putative integral membrane protein (TIGR02587 family)